MKAPILLPTLPAFTAIDGTAGERLALLAGLTFVEGSTSWEVPELSEWLTTYAPALGRMGPPASVTDTGVGVIALKTSGLSPTERALQTDRILKLLAIARWRVVVTLRGLLALPADDRFLQAAIFAGRVRRRRSSWLAEPRETEALSDTVLSLFAVDVLSHREFHEQNLCVCDVCGRISYNPTATTRAGCAEHVPAAEGMSGFRGRSVIDE